MAELALMLEVAGAPVGLLDDAVHAHDLTRAHQRYTERLRGLRERRGPVPHYYPHGSETVSTVVTARGDGQAAARTLLGFAECLHDGTPQGTAATVPTRGGWGAAAIAARADWRPLPIPPVPHTIVEVDIPAELIWRAWMVLPELGTTRVVAEQQLTPSEMDVWMGVHDGTHLDHMACFDTTMTTPIEFGTGLLTTEALAMAAEVLAGAEALAAGDLTTQATVRVELVERVGRLLPAVGPAGPCAELAERLRVRAHPEFASLPTLAHAYVAGPLRLIATGFVHPLISEPVRRRFAQRWAHARRAVPAAQALNTDARQPSRQHPLF